MNKENKLKNRLSVTVRNENLLNDINGLVASKRFSSKKEVVNKCLEIAVPLLVSGKADFTRSEKNNDVSDTVKKQTAMLRDLTVLVNIIFNMLQSLFTERVLTLEGKQTNAGDLMNGVYENLPKHYQALLSELLKV